ncbi:non-hemolytic phospholipase C [Caballeronia hypogeia]|uniref:phospholipase C n=1 Tax=Caballeronia hypogeia TaxID=1777140 RepID=A0A158BYC0_9BURK|nr:phospholipase C, phosphocholine-specific [Caballeronia hypogeia]SAK75001.1 non-hemolytic phospholipase C [Caballeronia hypogeia]
MTISGGWPRKIQGAGWGGEYKSRRDFLRFAASTMGAAAVAAATPRILRQALESPRNKRTGTINDVEHIVILTQENRSFDHYFGALRGVRGFNDRMAITLPNGDPIWRQPTETGYILPFHVDTTTTRATCMKAPTMSYPVDLAMWNKGLCNGWNIKRAPGLGMSYFTRGDLRFYYALADAFTICDQYYASTFTQTNPNRLHLFSGSSGLSVGLDPTLDNSDSYSGFTWPTVAETLEKAGISWRVYEQADNFDDNALAWFKSFKSAPVSSELYRRGMARVDDIVRTFAADVAAGTLPQVSWIIAPTALSEHANYHPQAGEDLTARLLAGLIANPVVWSRTVFLLNYDEQGGFFDHEPPPTPPATDAEGKSTLSTTGEVYEGFPIGLGFRVPMTIVSPWSKGGYVCSEVFDHTSIIQFIEHRFGIQCANISPWRRSICGDLSSAFDFESPDHAWPFLPDTSRYVSVADSECASLPEPNIPAAQRMPRQEPGTRPSRALPYEHHVDAYVHDRARMLELRIINKGRTGAGFSAYDLNRGTNPPRRYSLREGSEVVDRWSHADLAGTRYNIAVRGANGFLRAFAGDVAAVSGASASNPEVRVTYDAKRTSLCLAMTNSGHSACRFVVLDNGYRQDGPWAFSITAQGTANVRWPVSSSGNWYDFTVTVEGQPHFLRRFAGRIESGGDLTSDPAAA